AEGRHRAPAPLDVGDGLEAGALRGDGLLRGLLEVEVEGGVDDEAVAVEVVAVLARPHLHALADERGEVGREALVAGEPLEVELDLRRPEAVGGGGVAAALPRAPRAGGGPRPAAA